MRKQTHHAHVVPPRFKLWLRLELPLLLVDRLLLVLLLLLLLLLILLLLAPDPLVGLLGDGGPGQSRAPAPLAPV
jgi:hypothetical protein